MRDAETLQPAISDAGRPMRVLAAAWLGKTRLIDNTLLPGGVKIPFIRMGRAL